MDLPGFKAGLKSDLQAIFSDLDPNATAASKAQQMADAIGARTEALLLSVVVTTTVSTVVTGASATGGPVTGTGTGTGTGTLS